MTKLAKIVPVGGFIVAAGLTISFTSAQTTGVYAGNTPVNKIMYWTEQVLSTSDQQNVTGVLQAVRTQLEAWKSGDQAGYAATLAPVHTYFAPWTPKVVSVVRAQGLGIFSNEPIFDYEVHQPVHVNVVGDVAVVAYAIDLEPQRSTPGPLYQPSKITSIWHFQNGVWVNTHTHLSPLVDKYTRVAATLPASFAVALPSSAVIPVTTEQQWTPAQAVEAHAGVNFARAHWDAWKAQDGTFFTNNLGSMGTYYGPWTPSLQLHDSATFAVHYPQTYSQVSIIDYNMNGPVHVDVFDNVVVLTYNVDVNMSEFGHYTSHITHIAAYLDGQWHMVHAHESRVAVYQ